MREMKDSGLPWIGKIPVEWSSSHLKYVCSFKTGGTPNNKKGIDNEGDYMWVTPPDINDSYNIMQTKQWISKEAIKNSGYTLFPNQSVLLVCIASVGKVGMITEQAYSNQQITALKPKSKIVFPKYLLYSIVAGSKQIAFDASSNVIPIVNSRYLEGFSITFPVLNEQIRIADFLDSKCAEIDALSADIQSEIDTLEAYKRSVITEAVTKGLDKNVLMKDSGIEWVGEIPAGWEIHPVYVYFGERKNKNFALQERNLLSLSYGKIIRKDIDTVGGLLPASFNTYNIVEAGDIIIRPTDLQNDKRSLRTGLVTEKGIITSAYIDLAPKGDINSAYFHYLLHSYDVQKVFYNMGNGVRQGLNYSEFSKLMVFAPSRDEQDIIVFYLNGICAEIDSIIAQKKDQRAVLADYKKSVIYEYVTGKKEISVA